MINITAKICSISEKQLNAIYPDFGSVLIGSFPNQESKTFMLHKESSAMLFNSTIPHHFKQLLEMLIHFLNHQKYISCQLVRSSI